MYRIRTPLGIVGYVREQDIDDFLTSLVFEYVMKYGKGNPSTYGWMPVLMTLDYAVIDLSNFEELVYAEHVIEQA